MTSQYVVVMEDAGRYLPHSPIGREYLHYVMKGMTKNPITGQLRPHVVFTGTKAECEAFVAARIEESRK